MRDGARESIEAFLDRSASPDVADANMWTHVVDAAVLREQADALDAVPRSERGPLHGMPVAVKDNIDVAGIPTTAGAPAFAYVPEGSSPVVERLAAAGAIVVGKTNLDQFATGLSGTRAPAFGVCPNPLDRRFIAGGSSSGSAVAVATGLVPLAIGTDTAGSGRVPAACCGIVGLKPTRGWISTAGVVPASPTFDTVSLFTRSIGAAATAFTSLAGEVLPSARPRSVGVPRTLDWFGDDDAQELFDHTVAAIGAEHPNLHMVIVDIEELLAAGALLYGSALLAERDASFGAFIRSHREDVDPAVRDLVLSAARSSAADAFRAQQRLTEYRTATAGLWNSIDVLVVPTIARHPTVAEALDDSIATSRQLGTYTTFVNLLDLAAVSFPSGRRASGLPFGVTVIAPAGADGALLRFAAELNGEGSPSVPTWPRLVVVGAHLHGMPLNPQLVALGARLIETTTTSERYRLYDLGTEPPRPGLVRDKGRGAAITAELWEMSNAALGAFVAGVPAPLCIGTVELADGTAAPGFLCEPHALVGAREITEFGGWRAYLDSRPPR
jgi:allophanate hydrolase